MLAYHLGATGHDTRLRRGWTCVIGHNPLLVHTQLLNRLAQTLAHDIITHDSRQEDLRAKRIGVDRDISRPTQDSPLLIQIKDQDRGFARDTSWTPNKILISN